MNKIMLFFLLVSVFNVFYAADSLAKKEATHRTLLGKLVQGSSSDDEDESDPSLISLKEAKEMVNAKYPEVVFCEEFFSSPDFFVFVKALLGKKLKESHSSEPTAYEKLVIPRELLKSQYSQKSKE